MEEDEIFNQETNEIMSNAFPEHAWNELQEKEKSHLVNTNSDSDLYKEVLLLTIDYLRWLEHNYDKPTAELDSAWEKHKPKVIERVNSRMINT